MSPKKTESAEPATPLPSIQNAHYAFKLAAKCSRAFVKADRATAEIRKPSKAADDSRPTLLAAKKAELNRFLQHEDCSEDEWKTYSALWSQVSGRSLIEEEEGYRVVEGEKGRDRYRPKQQLSIRPNVFRLLQMMFRSILPQSILTDWYRSDVRSKYAIRDTPEFISYSQDWIARFNQISASIVPRDHALGLASHLAHDPRWTEGLVEVLEYLAILQSSLASVHSYHVRFKADPAFVLTNIFGRSTGISGLDYLFFGGLWPLGALPAEIPGTENLTVVVSGSPGMGKSTLGMQLGVQVAARGGLCVLFRFEPDELSILRQLRQFLPNVDSYCRIATQQEQQDPVPPDDWRGLVVLSDIEAQSPSSIRETAIRVATQDCARYPERIVIFDSISAAQHYADNKGSWRTFLHETAKQLRAAGFVVVYIVEEKLEVEDSFEDYVADVDLHLARNESPNCPYPFRTLEIVKSRWQMFHRGRHIYSISTGTGIEVFPSSPAVLGARARREARTKYNEAEYVDPGVTNFAKYIGNGKLTWWRPGSVTALIGPRGTRKAAFADSFARSAGGWTKSGSTCLSLHFTDELGAFHTQFTRENRKPSKAGVRYDIKAHQALVSHVFYRSGYLAPGVVLEEVRKILTEKRREQVPVRRAVIVDAGNIAPNFPALRTDPVFVPTLCDLLSSEGITTVVVYSRPEHGAEDYVIDQVRSVADNILRFDSLNYGGRECSTIRVERSSDSTHDHRTYEIRMSETPKQALEICPSFDLVLDLDKDKPKTAQVRIVLDAGTKLQKLFHARIKQEHEALGSHRIELLDNSETVSRRGFSQSGVRAKDELWIVQFDGFEYHTRGAIGASRQMLLSDLSAYCDEISTIKTDLAFPSWANAWDPSKTNRLYGLPYFLNPSFLVLREDFAAHLGDSNDWRTIAEGLGDYSWEDLITAAEQYKDRAADGVLFDYTVETTETLNCLFLEVLFSLNAGSPERIIVPGRDIVSLASLGKELPALAVRIVHRLLRDWWRERQSRPDVHESKRAGSQALVSRHWYSTYREMIAEGTNKQLPGFRPIRLPGNLWTNGDWYMGVLRDSVGPRKGYEIIREEFINETSAVNLVAEGVGLPPFRAFYDNPGLSSLTELPLSWFAPYVDGEKVIYRSRIADYSRIAPALSHLLSALTQPTAADSDGTNLLSLFSKFEGAQRKSA